MMQHTEGDLRYGEKNTLINDAMLIGGALMLAWIITVTDWAPVATPDSSGDQFERILSRMDRASMLLYEWRMMDVPH